MQAFNFSGCKNDMALHGGMGCSFICLRSPDPTRGRVFVKHMVTQVQLGEKKTKKLSQEGRVILLGQLPHFSQSVPRNSRN
jgi:hypothetical protein